MVPWYKQEFNLRYDTILPAKHLLSTYYLLGIVKSVFEYTKIIIPLRIKIETYILKKINTDLLGNFENPQLVKA